MASGLELTPAFFGPLLRCNWCALIPFLLLAIKCANVNGVGTTKIDFYDDETETEAVMKTIILLVTWFVPGQPATSYQSAFSSAEACEAARVAVFAEATRLKAQRDQNAIEQARATNNSPAFFLAAAPPAPTVTAVCMAQ
jgi:hypothetical protein